mmetsp:Transcript_12091/g.25754  ORF Transcript_12091/g.25754 Transcript_12091/m.25754 type:complete len:587 (-) Transcript_12091:57-1817(-)|eukprot:CAMPEP_0183739048 /NCGR_PEP_ID=MMETSP0737-20130205/56077_1 /TAXON_ID=385413 /ORGANISM="Thalassiosira miniscula, Strain CCMP1093" /LENGTH=586 /DNA_ID=CAMNT_0025973731 /DNA_START=65 /DNA_END=1825 /DNA_ORIENTATION=-
MKIYLKNWFLSAALLHGHHVASASEAVISPTLPADGTASPYVGGRVFINGVAQDAPSDTHLPVYGCCASTAVSADECPEGTEAEHQRLLARIKIGTMPQMSKERALEALQSAVTAWNGGSGTWPQMSLSDRIDAIQKFMGELKPKREDIVNVLMHEIGKNRPDAEAEFDRTMQFIEKTIDYIKNSNEFGSGWDASNGPTRLFLSRAAIGVVLCLGPYNYPLNETYATLIPALLMGNVAVLKIPTVGGLAHLLTIEAFAKALPPGTINFISGSGRVTMPPLMESGKIDSLAFIGGSNAADKLIKAHPEPHRLKVFLQLEAKNMGVYLPDLFESGGDDLDRVIKETITGTLSYNGQRCTALKLLFVPKAHSEQFATMLAKKIESLSVGLPWESTDSKFSQITPLPYQGRVDYMKSLISDAVEKGAKILNKNGGKVVGEGVNGGESTLMVPALLYPVTPDMKVYEEEQFGPVIPIAPYDSLDEIIRYSREGKYGQQVSIFTSSNKETSAELIDHFSTVFGKININSQCGRSPDTCPFSGRRSSAMGVMSVMHALHEFSIPTVVSYKDVGNNDELVKGIEAHSKFMQAAF